MASRNRTAQFLKYRDAVRQTRPSSSQSDHNVDLSISSKATRGGYVQLELSESIQETSASPSLPPLWVDLSEKVKEEMQKARSKMGELSKAQARALLPNFDTSKSSTHEENIEILTQEITRILKRCEKHLQRLTQDLGPDENSRICKNVQRSMATDLQSLSMDFRKQSKVYLQRLEQQQEKPVSSGSKSTALSEDDEFFDPGFSETQLLRVKRLENVSAAREQEVQEIIGAVNELAQMMKDLSVLVIDQGTVVDRIDYNIQNVSASVQKGVTQLQKAQEKQKRNLMVYCIMLLVVLCVAMLLILVLKKLLF